jgi:hypothetical protein
MRRGGFDGFGNARTADTKIGERNVRLAGDAFIHATPPFSVSQRAHPGPRQQQSRTRINIAQRDASHHLFRSAKSESYRSPKLPTGLPLGKIAWFIPVTSREQATELAAQTTSKRLAYARRSPSAA